MTPVDRLMNHVIAREVTNWSNLNRGYFEGTFNEVVFNVYTYFVMDISVLLKLDSPDLWNE
jgi:hypothetical protein